MASGNPALNEKTFSDIAATTGPVLTEAMTLEGTALKAGFLSLLVVGGAAYTWNLYFTTQSISAVTPWIWIGSIAGFIGIGFSVFVIIIASLNLVVDFDFIEQGVQEKCPKYMEP